MISKKGFNQVDLIIGLTILVFVTFFALYYTTHFLQPSISLAKSADLKSTAKGLSDTVFGELGTPEDWQWHENNIKPSLGSYIYRTPLRLIEYDGQDNNNVVLSVNIQPSENIFNSTIRVYDGNQPLLTNVTNATGINGFLEKFIVSFQVNIQANEEKIVYVYYSKDNGTLENYEVLEPTTSTVHIKQQPEKRYMGLTVSKMNALQNIDEREVREKYGIDKPFRFKIEKSGEDWEYGEPLSDKEVSLHKKSLIFQNETGYIESICIKTYVWL